MTDDEVQEDIDRLLNHDRLCWLFGAGTSFASGLPLMVGLTHRVLKLLESRPPIHTEAGDEIPQHEFASDILSELGPGRTVEQLLDQVADYLAMASRSDSKTAFTFKGTIRTNALSAFRLSILTSIRDTIRYGYIHDLDPAQCKSGGPTSPIVTIETHLAFIDALFGELRADRRRAACIEIYTTNYDTLLEDSLSLGGISCADGFNGGAVGFWDSTLFDSPDTAVRLFKLHGSIDWTMYRGDRPVRRRNLDTYPNKDGDLLIYPQASKYDLSKREPFDTLFYHFRQRINRPEGQVLGVCGYGFGDSHIDHEIESAMARQGSDLTLVIFAKDITSQIAVWQDMSFSDRLYILTEDGVWRGKNRFCVPAGGPHEWWTFEGMTKRLQNVRLAIGSA